MKLRAIREIMSDVLEVPMNAFREHHEDSIRSGYRCFDRVLLNGLIQPFQQPERVVRFFTRYRDQSPVTRQLLRDIASQYPAWIEARARERGIPVLAEPEGRRDEFVDRFFRRAKPDEVVVILKAREPARILTAIGTPTDNRWHLQFAERWVVHDNSYLNEPATNDVRDYGIAKAVEHLPPQRQKLAGIVDAYLDVQQDILDYAPLPAGLLQPVGGDGRLQDAKRHQLDRLHQRVVDDLDRLLAAVGLKVAA